MKKTGLYLALAAALGLGMTACNRNDAPATGATATAEQTAPATQDNPFFVQSDLPLQYPHFDTIKDEHFAPAFDAGMAEQL
jgi:peptidyl-dipeptidase Dcp